MAFNKKYLLFLLALFCAASLKAQERITGHVSDSRSLTGLAGAAIKAEGSSTGTSSDESGFYSLTVPENKSLILRFSFIGYKDSLVNVSITGISSSNNINVWLVPKSFETGTVFITATRAELKPDNIPGRIEIIDKKEIENNPVLNADDILEIIPGMNIDRDWGIFSKNSSVSMRGLSGTPRTLVLLDGSPLNKTDGGGINWNMINPDAIERIEVIKGPVSTMYGGNAMSGVINIISQRPTKDLDGNFKVYYGTYNTFGASTNLSGEKFKNDKGFYYDLNGFYKKGDGYITAPDSTRNKYDIKTYVEEYSGSFKGGYQFNPSSWIDAEYTYYDDKRGEGTRIFEKDGTYDKYTTNSLRATLNYLTGRSKIVVNSFYLNEIYFRQNETMSLKKNNKYTLYDTDANRTDKGIWCGITTDLRNNQILITGVDLKQGSIDGSDIYFTSSDVLTNKGKMNFLALFSEYEISTLKNKIKLNAGIRYDIARFEDGSFVIADPSTLTSFMSKYPTNFTDNNWQAFSPKLAVKYFFHPKLNLYISYARGFRAPMLDDMCKNGNVTKGFKIANPQLKPETLDNYEIGFNFNLGDKLIIQPSFYHSIGLDFQYFVNSGDSTYTGGDNLKPIIQRKNISKAQINGAEISVSYNLSAYLNIIANYAYNNSTILKFNGASGPADDFTGKYITGVSPNQFFIGFYWKNKFFNSGLSFNYMDKQWSDDMNTIPIPGYNSVDFKILRSFHRITAAITVHDILNNRHLNEKGELSPGRFFMFSLSYKI